MATSIGGNTAAAAIARRRLLPRRTSSVIARTWASPAAVSASISVTPLCSSMASVAANCAALRRRTAQPTRREVTIRRSQARRLAGTRSSRQTPRTPSAGATASGRRQLRSPPGQGDQRAGEEGQLDISQEVSSLTTAVTGAADLITNRRSIKTTVLADNGGTIVLGGLITDDRQSTRSEVPGLGKLPVIGGLFRSRGESTRKQTLFVFLRPTILRTRSDAAKIAGNRFQRLKAIEAQPAGKGSLLADPQPVKRLPVEVDGIY